MRTEILKRIEKLEANARARAATTPDFGQCLSEAEWRQALSVLDPDPHVAFSMLTSDHIDVSVIVVGAPALPFSFRELVSAANPAVHFWAGRMAAWVIQLDGGRVHPCEATAETYASALEALFGWDGAGASVHALRQALLREETMSERGPIVHCIHLIAARPQAIETEISGDDARL